MPKPKRSARIAARITPDLLAALNEEANAQRRSLGSMISILLSDALAQRAAR